MTLFRPARGGFLRAFGCAQFIISFLKGEAPFGAPAIDPRGGSPQQDIFREYKGALRRAQAEDMVALEVEKRIKRGKPTPTVEEADDLVRYFFERLPYRSTKMRYHSFIIYFGILKRLGWVEPTGEQEISEVQDLMALKPEEESRETGQARIYYRITGAGSAAAASAIADPITALYDYPKEVRSSRQER